MTFNWTCPFCNRDQTVGNERHHTGYIQAHVGRVADGRLAMEGEFIGCANPDCSRLTATVAILPMHADGRGNYRVNSNADPILVKSLLPEGAVRPQPSFIPRALVEDYREACLIVGLSPKASATLIRRCLQGMIREFTGISEKTLFKEIDSLRIAVENGSAPRGVTEETIDAIDHVRKIGNIGAHMESDINHIIEVDKGEAEALISLVEMLFDEWYVARNRRQERLSKIAAIATEKEAARKVQAISDKHEI